MLELASVNDKMVQAIKTSPPAFSLSKKSLNNFVALIDNVCLLNVCRVSVRVAGNTQIYETFLFLQIYLHVDIQLFKKNVYLRILYIKM